jgi:hypothetical protein
MNYTGRGFQLTLFFGLLLLANTLTPAPSLYGGGLRDPGLVQADKFIEARQFDEAVRLLSEYTEEDSTKFYQAQKRLRKIILLRERYNTIAGQLLDVLTTDPDNSEKILNLTRQLEALEPAKGTVQQFIPQVRELAQFGYNQTRLERIMVQGRELLDQGDYAAAINCYASGLDIYREEFFAAGYGDIINNQISNSIARIGDAIQSFSGMVVPFKTAAAGVDRIGVSGGANALSQLRDYYARLLPLMEQMITLNNAMAEEGNRIDAQLARFRQEDPNLGDRNYLSFVSRIVHGRAGTGIQEGMLGAIAGLWISALSPFDAALKSNAEQSYQAAADLLWSDSALNNQNFAPARARFESVVAYCTLARTFFGDWRRFYLGQDVPGITTPGYRYFDDRVIAAKAEDYLQYVSMSIASASLMGTGDLIEQYRRLSSLSSNALESWRRRALNTPNAMAQEAALRKTFHDLVLRVDTVLESLRVNGETLKGYRYDLTGEALLYPPMENALSFFSGMDTNSFDLETASAVREYAIGNGDLQRRLTDWRNQFGEANRFFEGSPVPGADYIAKYPGEALSLFVRIDQGTSQGLADGKALIARYDDEPPRFINEPRISGLSLEARALMREIEELRNKTLPLERMARTQADQAYAFRLDGDRLYQEARDALARSNFDVARDRALRSGERYDASLVIQESAGLRSTRDANLVNLGAEITRLENEAIIREVRDLVNDAQNTYFAGSFGQSEEYLVRARDRWRRTNVEDNAEVNYWLTVVRGAMSLQSGRNIPVTAPLYPEMSQILSNAKKNYDDGIRLINGNRRQEGLARFVEARRKIREVKLMFPVNQEASILELRMDQVADPGTFEESFRRRLDQAVAGTKRNSVESFADLQNLAEINPDYPGIQAMVSQAEIDMGYRPAPPDPRSLTRSAELVASAQTIIDRNLRAQFPVALEQLNQALLLNPSNSQAMILKDRVQIELGGGDSVILSSAVEREYRRAVQELQQGNTLVALTIVRQLLQEPRNRNSTRIQDLQRRIESVL